MRGRVAKRASAARVQRRRGGRIVDGALRFKETGIVGAPLLGAGMHASASRQREQAAAGDEERRSHVSGYFVCGFE